MRVYLDDDLDSNALIGLLRGEGHEVVSPRDTGMRGASDEEHLIYSTAHGLVVLSANARDFLDRHSEWKSQQREHQGILLVYRENNAARDMNFHQIAKAVTRIERSGLQLEDSCHNLNFWRQK